MPNPHTIATVACANCGLVKQESNYWWIVRHDKYDTFSLYPFGSRALTDDMRPLCGQACVQREVEVWMTEIRNAKERSR